MDRDERNLIFLEHVDTYGLALPEFAEVFYEGKDFAAIFKKAPWDSYFERHHKKAGDALPGGVSFITETGKGRARLGHSKEMPNNSQAAIAQRLPVYWFCNAEAERHLITSEDAAKILGGAVPNNVAFVLAHEKDGYVIYRVYVASGDVSQATNRVRAIRDELAAAFPDWPAARQLGIAVLAETPEKVSSIREAVGRMKLGERVIAALGPTPDTIAECLRARRKRGKK
jgi:hypothetical protein